MATSAQLQTWIDEAELALHVLTTGGMMSSVQGPEEGASYTPTNREDLERHITLLKSAKSVADGGRRTARTVIRFGV